MTAVRTDVLAAPWVDGLMLLDPLDRRLHQLNASAAAVWHDLQQGEAPGPAVGRLAGGVDAERVRSDVAAAVRAFDRAGLLAGAGPTTTDRPSSSAPAPKWSPAARAEPSPQGAPLVRRARAGEWPFSVLCGVAPLVDDLDALLAPLARPPAEEPGVVIRVEGTVDRVTVRLGDEVVARDVDPGSALDRLVAALNRAAVTGNPRCVALHAGAVSIGGATVVLPGAADAGKSTLVAGLVEAGADYLTDEVALLDPRTSGVVPYPKAIALDAGSFPLLASWRPHVGPLLRRHRRRKWYCPVPAAGAGGSVVDQPVGAVVAPRYRPGAPTTIERLEPREALDLLLRNSFDFAAAGQAGFTSLVGLVAAVPVHRLEHDDLDGAVAAVIDAVG